MLAGVSIPRRKMPLTGANDKEVTMSEKYDPLRNAELTVEQNGNMIDGIINNLSVSLPEEKPLDKVREIPPKRRSREREER